VYIKKTIELEDGSIDFEGNLSPDEVRIVIETGLSYLFKVGALPFVSLKKSDAASFSPFTRQS
jgi:hypothetical protein